MSRNLKLHEVLDIAVALFTTATKFEAGMTTTLQPFTIIKPMFTENLKLYSFHTMDNREQFFRNYLDQYYLVSSRRRVTILLLRVATN